MGKLGLQGGEWGDEEGIMIKPMPVPSGNGTAVVSSTAAGVSSYRLPVVEVLSPKTPPEGATASVDLNRRRPLIPQAAQSTSSSSPSLRRWDCWLSASPLWLRGGGGGSDLESGT